mmetsp:Transcript_10703/g.32930  ORF Transcript_10703/g.32930 Transcript_10703/m.32930 type:complete len:318 (+) Transcript_10703:619-1572(+)
MSDRRLEGAMRRAPQAGVCAHGDGAPEAGEGLREGRLTRRVPALPAAGARGEHAEAERVLETARRLDPDSGLVADAYAAMLCDRGRLDEGIALYERIASVESHDAVPQGNCARAHQMRGTLADIVRSLELYDRATALDPTNGSYVCMAGMSLLRQGRLAEGLAKFDRAIVLEAHNPASALIPHANAGGVRLKLGQFEKAAEHHRACLKANPNDPLATAGLAQAMKGLRNGPATVPSAPTWVPPPPAPAPAPPEPARAPWRSPDDYSERVRAMGIKALRAEAASRGVDISSCVEKADLVSALEDNAAASRAEDAEEID